MEEEKLDTLKQAHKDILDATATSNFVDSNEILRGRLWIGDENDGKRRHDNSMLVRHNINAILSIGDNLKSYVNYNDIEYYRILCPDMETAPLHEHFDKATEFIHDRIQEGKHVLVHCGAGISRSVTICIAYLIRYHHLTWSAAFMCVKDARCDIYPNDGFLEQLKAYEKRF